MALLWVEGFEGYGTTTGVDVEDELRRRYPDTTTSVSTYLRDGRYNGYSVRANGSCYYRTPALTTDDTLVFGMAIQARTGTLYENTIMDFVDGTTVNVRIKVDPDFGELNVFRGTSTLLGTTAGAQISRMWTYVEVKVVCHDTAGSVEIHVDGRTVLSLTNIDTKAGSNAYCDRVYIVTPYYYYHQDDIYVLDSTGSINNDFLGPQHVIGIFPNGDSATVQWTTSTGTDHYALVDETLENDDTDYVESSSVGNVDLWDYQALSGVDTIAGIQINTTAKLTDATPYDLITKVYSGTTTSDDSGQAATTSYLSWPRVLETNPDTSTAWNVSAIDSLQAGVEVG